MQYHILLSRINPSLKIDLARVCTIKDGQAVALTPDEVHETFKDSDLAQLLDFLVSSHISDSMYIMHEQVSELIGYLMDRTTVSIDYFDNNLVIVFDHGTEKETSQEK